MRRPLVLSLAALLAAACVPQESPADRYRRFTEAARRGRSAEVWAMLSERSRRAFADRARALAGESPSAGLDLSAEDMVLGDLAPTAPKVKSVTVLRESREVSVVSVQEVGSGKGEVSLVREGGQWKVELPNTPSPSP